MSAMTLSVPTAKDMKALGEALGSMLGSGDVVALTGDLGAGKTTLVQGAAVGLGVESGQVASPTFTLVREYRGREPVFHVDVYRLERVQDVIDLGFEELLDPDGVTFVEWGDAIEGLMPDSYLQIELLTRDEDERRTAVVVGKGPMWANRWERLEALLQPWASAGASGTGRPT
jgi:tRNA threonylcarbamoyladenosine biosynthesis protein TsaE